MNDALLKLLIKNNIFLLKDLNFISISVNNNEIGIDHFINIYKIRYNIAKEDSNLKNINFIESLLFNTENKEVNAVRIVKIRGLMNKNIIVNSDFNVILGVLEIIPDHPDGSDM